MEFKMKNLTILLSVCFVMLLLGCDQSVSNDWGDLSTGVISINLPSGTRDITSTIAQDNLDMYEIIAYNDTTITSIEVSTDGGTGEIIVPVGNYKVLILAGLNTTSSSYKYLLGSGVSNEITVVEDQITPVTVSMVVSQSTLTVDTQDTIRAGDTFSVTVSVDLGCSVLSLSGAADWVDFDTQSVSASLNGTTSTSSVSFTAPQVLGDYDVEYNGTYISLVDNDYSRSTLLSTSNGLLNGWYSLGSNFLSEEDTTFNTEISKTISILASATGIEVTIEWL